MEEKKNQEKGVAGALKSLKGIKHIEVIAGVCILAILLLIAFGGGGESSSEKTETSDAGKEIQANLANELETVLGSIKGAGKVKVLITYETTSEIVPAYNEQSQHNKTTETDTDGTTRTDESSSGSSSPVTINSQGGSTTLILTEKMPQIRGVIIVAEGAGNVNVRLDLLRAAKTVLCINADKVDVFEMK